MGLTDDMNDLVALEDALREARERADWVARYTETPGVKDLASSVKLAVSGLLSVQAAMVELVDAFEAAEVAVSDLLTAVRDG